MSNCLFCAKLSEQVILNNHVCRVILVQDDIYPGYVQVVANKHVKELTDLSRDDANVIFETIWQLETKIRQIINPDKVNIASLGNMVPHLHWHIIPRFINDKHFPNPIWGNITNQEYKPSDKLVNKQQLLFI